MSDVHYAYFRIGTSLYWAVWKKRGREYSPLPFACGRQKTHRQVFTELIAATGESDITKLSVRNNFSKKRVEICVKSLFQEISIAQFNAELHKVHESYRKEWFGRLSTLRKNYQEYISNWNLLEKKYETQLYTRIIEEVEQIRENIENAAKSERKHQKWQANRSRIRSSPSRQVVIEVFKYFNLTPSATVDHLKDAYRRLAQKLHPDRGGATAKFQQLQKNYKTALRYILN